MVELNIVEDHCSVLIVLLKHPHSDVERVYSEHYYSNNNMSVDRCSAYSDSVESVVLQYCDKANYLYLEGKGMPQYNADTLSLFASLHTVHICSVTVPHNQSYEFFSNDTVRHLEMFIVHGINDLGDMPKLQSVNMTSCVMNVLPNITREKYPDLTTVTITTSAIIDQSPYTIYKMIDCMRSQGITVDINGTFPIMY